MTSTHSARGLVWTDLSSPTDEEVSILVKRYDLSPLVGEELRDSPSAAKIEFFKDYFLVVLTLPVRIKQNGAYAIVDREVDFVVGKDFLITSHPEVVEPLEYFAKIFETNAILSRSEPIEHAGHLFYYLIKRIYVGMAEDIANIKDALITAESRVFKNDERKMVEVLSGLSRELIDFRQTVRIQREVWNNMVESIERAVFGSDFKAYIRDIRDEFNRLNELIDNARELLADLRETNDSLLNTKQNEIIKLLTLVSFVLYPPSFVAWIFSIPAVNVPFVETGYGWWALVAIMAAMGLGMWLYFRTKKWM